MDTNGRRWRLQLPNLVAGVVIGGLVVGAVAPLVGSDRTSPVTSGAPDFLQGSDDVADAGGGGGDGDPAVDAADGGVGGGTVGTGTGGGGSTEGGTGRSGTISSGGSGTSGGDGAEPLTASDIGVTEEVIRVGTITLNCKACAAVGVGSLDNVPHTRIVAAFVDDINARGGINGRKLELYTADYDPAEDAVNGGGTERAACIELTERRKVFAVVIGGATSSACVYDEHETPLITATDPSIDDPGGFNANEGRVWFTNSTSARTLRDWAVQLERQALLPKDARFGVVVVDGPHRQQVEKHLLPALKDHGYTPTHVSVLPNDFATIATKAATEVPAMRAKGVTHVLMAINYVAAQSWLRESERNGWRPKYLQADFPNTAGDYQGGQNSQAAEAQWRGAIAVSAGFETTVEEARRHPTTKRCLDIYEKAVGRPATQTLQGHVYNYCNGYAIFERAARAAGPSLTRRALIGALSRLGEFPLAEAVGGVGSFGGRYGFGPVKWSATSRAQRKVWHKPCPRPDADADGCWVPDGPVYPMST